MTAVELKRYRDRRGAQAWVIEQEAEKYKVCSQCLSIAFKRAPVCPVCKAYRWKENPSAVTVVSWMMRKHPWPVTSGLPPRLA